MISRNNVWCPLFLALLLSTPANAEEESYEQPVMDPLPPDLQARVELRDRMLAAAYSRSESTLGFSSVLETLKTWSPGQSIKVAFRGGTSELRSAIASAATEWSRHANVTFDFGPAPQNGRFNEWNSTDTTYSADIRIDFSHSGYWSHVGTDSADMQVSKWNEASMNFGGFAYARPNGWKGTVLHEFGHALGFHHEHQHPLTGCDQEFRWNDDPGYVPTVDTHGQFIADGQGRRPGLYTVLGGPFNNWPSYMVDHNLRRLRDSSLYTVRPFDPRSIMKYHFPEWMFVSGASSICYTNSRNDALSAGDQAAARDAYPSLSAAIDARFEQKNVVLRELSNSPVLDVRMRDEFKRGLRRLEAIREQ